MCSGGTCGPVVRKRTRDDVARERASYAYEVERAQQRFDELDRELREWGETPRSALDEVQP